MRAFARVTLLCMLLWAVAEAGWFGNKEEEKKASRRRERYGRSDKDRVEDTVAREPERPSRDDIRKKKRRAASRDEMISQEFNKEVLRDDEIEETVTPDDNQDGYLTDDEINRIWQEHMHDFVPEDMINAVVESRTTEALFETINHATPTTVKGAYYVYGGNTDEVVSRIVYDPNREIVYKRKGSAQGIIIFETTIPGEYAFIFANSKSSEDLVVTLALHTYEEISEPIKYDITPQGQRYEVTEKSPEESAADVLGGEENLAATEQEISVVRAALREIHTTTKQVQNEAKLSLMRQKGHNQDLLDNQSYNFYFMMLEVAAFAGVVAFQTHHIKKSLDNKLIL